MTNETNPRALPHHRLVAYAVAVELLAAVRASKIADARLREQALRAAVSACCNVAEGAARPSAADKARVFGIARAEAAEAAAAVEIAAMAGFAPRANAETCVALASRLYGLLHGLMR